MKLMKMKSKNYYKEWFFEDCGLVGEHPHLQVSLCYQDGGINYLTYKQERKGYYVHVSAVCRSEKDGYCTVSTTLGNGYKVLIQEITRRSKKSFEQALSNLEIGTFIAMCRAVGVNEDEAIEIALMIKKGE